MWCSPWGFNIRSVVPGTCITCIVLFASHNPHSCVVQSLGVLEWMSSGTSILNLLPLMLIGVWCSPWGYKPNEFRSPRDCNTWACAYEAKTDNKSPRDYTANLAAPGTTPAPHCYDHKKLMGNAVLEAPGTAQH